MKSVGEALVDHLIAQDVEVVFGIPGVHTVELYRGLETSGIRHVTPRHEQGAGFMADGYARVTGKPGVALIITGPGVTNILTPVAQARADSIPMLVISSENSLQSLGKGLGHLHELPDQHGLVSTVLDTSIQLENSADLTSTMDQLFERFGEGRPAPAHIQIPLDVAKQMVEVNSLASAKTTELLPLSDEVEQSAERLKNAKTPVILAGGGMRFDDDALTKLAELLDAPTVLTTNARGLMHAHDLVVPACPDLQAVRKLIEKADVVLALGTELGRTDYDVFDSGGMAAMNDLIRVDVSQEQLDRHDAVLKIRSDAGKFAEALAEALGSSGKLETGGSSRAEEARKEAFEEIGEDMRAICEVLGAIREAAPGSIMVGDSTQPIYAGNYYYDHDRPAGWFNAATGYGALGFGIPAAIGASIGAPETPVICLCGDGGAQFSYPEFMAAVDENVPVVFVIWNNKGYLEIEYSMERAEVNVVGCDPTPPNFELVAASCGMPYYKSVLNSEDVAAAMKRAVSERKPVLLEIEA